MDDEDMKIEANRLQTFSNWSGSVPVEPERIARGGFYATGNELEVQCPWCKSKISEWRLGDIAVMARHRLLDPLCPFVVNPTSSGNTPISSQPTQSEVVPVDLMNEQCRLATFKNWPITYVSPVALAKAGFYYYNQSDRVTCAWCHGVIAKWEEGDNPFTEHEKFFPNCPRVQLGPNITNIAGDGIRDLGIQQIQTPKREKYSCLDARIRTFSQWPRSDIQHPEVLATAGFYYLDIDDQVRCFHCNGGLRSWQKEDDPWYEHAKWFPKCQFVQLAKGSDYIQSVQEQTKPSLEEAMNTEPVQKALEMGLHEGRIRSATKTRLDTTGRPYTTVEALVDAVLDGQHNEEQGDDEDENNQSSSTIVQEVSRILDTIFNPRASSSSMNQDDEPVQDIDHNTQRVQVTENAQTDEAPKERTEPAVESAVESSSVPNTIESMESQQLSLEEENRKLKDARLCKICMVDEVGVVFLPCGHLVTCYQCATGVSACPLCRRSIKAYVRTFLS